MKKRSQVKCKIGSDGYYIDCSVHSVRMINQNTVELLVRIGKQMMWVPASEVILGSPIKMTLDLK